MNRRDFFKLFSALPVAAMSSSLGLISIASLSGCAIRAETTPSLVMQLSEFRDPRFDPVSEDISINGLMQSLESKGVYERKNAVVYPEKIADLAKTDKIIVMFDEYFTQTEVELYTLSSFVLTKYAKQKHITLEEQYREQVELLPKVDLMAGDLRGFRTSTGLDECRDACETNEECRAFTFAKFSHPNKNKKNMCWLKKDKFTYYSSGKDHYVSGIKP